MWNDNFNSFPDTTSFNEIERIEKLNVGYELVEALQRGLIMRATGSNFEDKIYKILRTKLIQSKAIENLIPTWIKDCRDTDQFWSFIKAEISGYEPRRIFIRDELSKLLNYFEVKQESHLTATLIFDEYHINAEWQKAIERKSIDPEGAITIARTMLESLFKYILDESKIEYDDSLDLAELYKMSAKILNMAPEAHQEQIFKQILNGVKSVVVGLGSLRNKLGDAHGKSSKSYKPKERHIELAVNLSGSVALFLYKTFKAQILLKANLNE